MTVADIQMIHADEAVLAGESSAGAMAGRTGARSGSVFALILIVSTEALWFATIGYLLFALVR